MDPLTLVGFLFALGALIFIHESGHFMVAKALGIKVEVFSLGFGPKIIRIPRGGTEYCISAIPLGGYVKMLGENPDEQLRGGKEEFLSRTKLERFFVLVMGATLNIVLAIVLTAGMYMSGMPEPDYLTRPAVIGSMDPNMAAAAAGLKVRDQILAIDGEPASTWGDMQLKIALNPERTVDFEIRRDGLVQTIPVLVGRTDRERIGFIGIGPVTEFRIGAVEEEGPAQEAGLREGDILASINGQEPYGPAGDVSTILEAIKPGDSVAIAVQRDGGAHETTLTVGERKGNLHLGMSLGPVMTSRRYGPVEAFSVSLSYNWEQAGLVFVTLKKLVSLQLSPRTLSGPIEIYRLTGESLRSGWIYYVRLMAIISLQLGIINLLPIPVLDGGHIFTLLIEGIARRDLSLRLKERVMQFGFVLLLLIMGGVLFLDVSKNYDAILHALGLR